MSEIRENGIQRLMRDNGELRAQVAQLALELTGCRDLIATLRNRVAEGGQENAQLQLELKERRIQELRERIGKYEIMLIESASVGGSRNFYMESQVEKMEKELAMLTESSDGK